MTAVVLEIIPSALDLWQVGAVARVTENFHLRAGSFRFASPLSSRVSDDLTLAF